MKIFTVCAVVAALSLSLPSALMAQTAKPSPKPAVARPAATAKPTTIWDHQKELGLSDDQVKQIRSAVESLQARLRDAQAKVAPLQADLKTLVADDTSDVDKIHTKLLEIYTLQADLKVADIQTSRTVKKILTPEQLELWQRIQARTRPASH